MRCSVFSKEPLLIHSTTHHRDLTLLLDLTASGDTQGFEDLYTATVDRVYSLAKAILHDSPDCDQTVQDIYVTIWSRATHYNSSHASPTAWILAIAHRIVIERLRARQSFSPTGAITATPVDYAERYGRTALPHVTALTAGAGLTTIEIDAIHLAYFYGFTTAAIAKRLHVKEISIRIALRNGLMRLRDYKNGGMTVERPR